MNLLILGIVLFGVPHLFSSLAPALRDGLKARFGERRWRGGYTLVTALGLVLMIWGFVHASGSRQGAEWLYLPEAWMRHVTMLLVLGGFIALAAARGQSHIRLWLRQPMSVGVSLWAIGHLLANGRKIAVILFGTFLLIALADIAASTLRGRVPAYAPQVRADVIAVLLGLVLYALVLFVIHPYVFGIPVAG
jgi:uncharacterized membrane protein